MIMFISFWGWGAGWGGGMISTPAQLTQPSLLCNEMGGMISTTAELLHPSKCISFWGWRAGWGG